MSSRKISVDLTVADGYDNEAQVSLGVGALEDGSYHVVAQVLVEANAILIQYVEVVESEEPQVTTYGTDPVPMDDLEKWLDSQA